MAILRIKNANGSWEEVPAIVGRKGDSITVKSVTPSDQDGGANVVVFSDGTEIHIKNGTKGTQGQKGVDGTNGISVTHSWNGTTLTVTSASGTSSKDLKGEKGNNATINGVNALVIEARDGIGITQNGNTITLHSSGSETGSASIFLNRSTRVNEADTNYTTIMARGSSLHTPDGTPSNPDNMVSGAIYWTYE